MPYLCFPLVSLLVHAGAFSPEGVMKYIIKVEDTEVCHVWPFAFFITGSYAIRVKYFSIRSFLAEEIKWIWTSSKSCCPRWKFHQGSEMHTSKTRRNCGLAGTRLYLLRGTWLGWNSEVLCYLQRGRRSWWKAMRTRTCTCVYVGNLGPLDFSSGMGHLALWVLQMRDHLYRYFCSSGLDAGCWLNLGSGT